MLSDLAVINNSYARNIETEIYNCNLEEAILLIKKSAQFERTMNAKETKAILLSEEEIQCRINRGVWIHGLTLKESTSLAYRRAKRLAETRVQVTTSIETVTFVL